MQLNVFTLYIFLNQMDYVLKWLLINLPENKKKMLKFDF